VDLGSKSDHELLEDYRSIQSQVAFAELVRRHLSLVYYTALRRLNGDAALAEDVTQSVFLALAAKAAEAQRRPALAGWLYRSTRFAAAQAVRTENRRRQREFTAHTLNDPNPSSPPSWVSRGPELDEALEGLSATDRELVLLRFFEGLPLAEVGGRFSISADAARMRLDRALEKLRRNLAQRGIASTAAAIAAGCAAQASQSLPLGLAERTLTAVWNSAPAIVTGGAGLVSVIVSAGWKLTLAAGLVTLGTVAVWKHAASQRDAAPPPLAETAAAISPPAPSSHPRPSVAVPSSRRPTVSATTEELSALDRRVQRLDALVHLSTPQRTKAVAIFTREIQLTDQFAPGPERVSGAMPIREASREQIRDILNEDQQAIYDDAPQAQGGGSTAPPVGAPAPSPRIGLSSAQLDQVLRNAPEVTGQVGVVQSIQRLPGGVKIIHDSATGKVKGYVGTYHVQIQGLQGSQLFAIEWERIPPDGPARVVKIGPIDLVPVRGPPKPP